VAKKQVSDQEVLKFRKDIKRLYSKNYLNKDIAEKLGIDDTYLSSLVNSGKSGKRPGKAIVDKVKEVFGKELKEIEEERKGKDKIPKLQKIKEPEEAYLEKIQDLEIRLSVVEKNTEKILTLLEGNPKKDFPSSP
jgi:transcriptional regulator with XRE-family HTH domain